MFQEYILIFQEHNMNIMEMFPEVKFYVSKVSFLLISSQYLIYSVNQGYYLLGVSLPGTIHKRLKGIDRQCMVVELRIQNKNFKKISNFSTILRSQFT